MKAKILITGGNGFIGASLAQYLNTVPEYSVDVTVRSKKEGSLAKSNVHEVADIDSSFNWTAVLDGVDCIVHTAGQAHILTPGVVSLESFRRINTYGTLNLARQAAKAGVRRFIFISSIGVNGARTFSAPFSEDSEVNPHADYALSKYEAEQGLIELSKESAMEIVIIRPPLVYAAHAPGNFQRLLKIVYSKVPLPFGSIHNSRSMIALENLVSFIAQCIRHPKAANELFLVADGMDLSISDIVRYLSDGMNRRNRLLSIPEVLLKRAALLVGKEGMYIQLCGSLTIDAKKSRECLDWSPPVTPKDALLNIGREYSIKRADLTN